MNNKSSSRSLVRSLFLLLCLLSVPLWLPLEGPTARAFDDYSCQTNLGFCNYNCAVAHQNDLPAYQACAAGCNLQYNSCATCDFIGLPPDCEGGYDFPEPYPVVSDFFQCMDNCANCRFLPFNEIGACFVPCKAHCIATYAQ
jgi:hypothetical protein